MTNDNDQLKQDLLDQIDDTHLQFVALMKRRLPESETRVLELYLAGLGQLVDKLEDPDKSLHAAAQEMFGELAGVMMRELG